MGYAKLKKKSSDTEYFINVLYFVNVMEDNYINTQNNSLYNEFCLYVSLKGRNGYFLKSH